MSNSPTPEAFPTWSRAIDPVGSLCDFINQHLMGMHFDEDDEPTPPLWIGPDSPLAHEGESTSMLLAPGEVRTVAIMTGEILDGCEK